MWAIITAIARVCSLFNKIEYDFGTPVHIKLTNYLIAVIIKCEHVNVRILTTNVNHKLGCEIESPIK